MNVSIGREEIRIVLRNTDKLIKKRLFCPTCGHYLCSYYDELAIIIEGMTQPQQRQVEVTCFNCKVVYQIV